MEDNYYKWCIGVGAHTPAPVGCALLRGGSWTVELATLLDLSGRVLNANDMLVFKVLLRYR